MKTSDITYCMNVMGFPNNKELTVHTINEQYRNIVNQNRANNDTPSNDEAWLDNIKKARKFLIDNVAEITELLIKQRLTTANNFFEQNMYNDAREEFKYISKLLPPGCIISEVISADECISYGICCLLTGLRVGRSHSYMFSYGYGGRWLSEELIDCEDYQPISSEFLEVQHATKKMLLNHPLIQAGINNGCSDQKYSEFVSIEQEILAELHAEFYNQEYLLNAIFRSSDMLAKYIGKNNGFFLYNGLLYYIYDDGNDNKYPIYSVYVKNRRIFMDFYKFSHYNKKYGGKILDHVEFSIKIITDKFLQLECITKNFSCGWCEVAIEPNRIDFQRYMDETRKNKCMVCGGTRILRVCSNLCKKEIQKNRS